jgi:hypothetical protein
VDDFPGLFAQVSRQGPRNPCDLLIEGVELIVEPNDCESECRGEGRGARQRAHKKNEVMRIA